MFSFTLVWEFLVNHLVKCSLQVVYWVFSLFSLYVNDTVMMSLIQLDVQFVSYVFIYLSVENFCKLFNLVFITIYLLDILFSLYVYDTVMMLLNEV